MTWLQVVRCALCEQLQKLSYNHRFDKYSTAETLNIEHQQSLRFIQEMCRRGFMRRVYRPYNFVRGSCYGYSMTRKWRLAASLLSRYNRLPQISGAPGVCDVPGCTERAMTYPFRRHFLCRDHLLNIGCRWCLRKDTGACAQNRCWETEVFG
jgi:hypothetical protein